MKRLYKDADWGEIRVVVGGWLGDGRYMKEISNTQALDHAATG
jgi:hypothetical protein